MIRRRHAAPYPPGFVGQHGRLVPAPVVEPRRSGDFVKDPPGWRFSPTPERAAELDAMILPRSDAATGGEK